MTNKRGKEPVAFVEKVRSGNSEAVVDQAVQPRFFGAEFCFLKTNEFTEPYSNSTFSFSDQGVQRQRKLMRMLTEQDGALLIAGYAGGVRYPVLQVAPQSVE